MSTVVAHPAIEGAPATPIISRLVGFVRLLRENGFPVGYREAVDAGRLARGVDLLNVNALRWGLRALLCSCRRDWKLYDELFDAYWLRRGMKRVALVSGQMDRAGERQLPESGAPAGPPGIADRVERGGAGDDAASGQGRRSGASVTEPLASADLRHINDPEELARLNDLTERLARRMRHHITRRQRVHSRGRRLDLRKIIHRSLAYGGMPMRLAFRKRREKPIRLVVILDASGSMSLYSAFFMRFIRSVIDNFRDAEAFVFHTRLIHISSVLKERNVEKALERMSLMASGWGGGTKIGESLATFNRAYAAGVLNSRSVVIIVSDGYDTGPPEVLAEELGRIKRRSRRLVWLNPMMGWDGYEPVARGMQAAMPHIDLFAPAHNLESLMALEPYLAKV